MQKVKYNGFDQKLSEVKNNGHYGCFLRHHVYIGERTKASWDKSPLGQKPTGQYPTGQKPTA